MLLTVATFCGCSKDEDKSDRKIEKEINYAEKFEMYADEDWCIVKEGYIDTNPYDIPNVSVEKAWNAIRHIARELGFSDTLVEENQQNTNKDEFNCTMTKDGSATVWWEYDSNTGYDVHFYRNESK